MSDVRHLQDEQGKYLPDNSRVIKGSVVRQINRQTDKPTGDIYNNKQTD